MSIPKEITREDLYRVRAAVKSPGTDGQNFDRLCRAVLVAAEIAVELLIHQKENGK